MLKQATLLFIFICLSYITYAQMGVNSTGTAPDNSAMLDVSSTTKGMLVPRMTTTERSAISSPANGLLVYDTDTKSFWYYKSTAWTELSNGSSTNYWTASGSTIYNNNSGAVGIGTSSPLFPLDIYHSSLGMARFSSGSSTGFSGVQFDNSAGNYAQIGLNGASHATAPNLLVINQISNNGIRIMTNNTDRMRIDNLGNVGIGTTSPTEKLEVLGKTKTTNFQMTNGATSGYILQSDASGNGSWVANTASADNLGNHTATQNLKLGSYYLSNDGNNKGLKVDSNGDISVNSTTNNNITLGDGTNRYASLALKNSYNIWKWTIGDNVSNKGSFLLYDVTNDTYPIQVFPNPSVSITLKNGNMGVGQSDPTEKLEVAGKTKTTYFQMTNGATNGYILQSDASGNASWVANTTSADNLGNHTATQTLNLGTNTITNGTGTNGLSFDTDGVPTFKNGSSSFSILNVDGSSVTDARLSLKTSSDAWNLNGMNNKFYIHSSTADNQPFVIDSPTSSNLVYIKGSNVGFGTNNPTEKLEVSGKTKTTNFQMTNGASSSYVLQSDASGNGSWVATSTFANNNWTTNGTNQYSALTGNVGIGVTSPTNKLEVFGTTKTTNFQMTNGATSGYILQSDASGNGSWVAATSSVTAGTGLSYLGSTLNSVWTTSGNNIYKNNSANVGIGTTSPTALLDVYVENTGTADVTVSQSGNSGSNTASTAEYQTFTAVTSGYLSKVSLFFTGSGSARTVTIYQGSGTGGTSLGTSASVTPSASGFTDFTFSGISITSGSVYTISVTDQSNWRYSLSSIYSGGVSSKGSSYDYNFISYVSSANGSYNMVAGSSGIGIGTTSPTERLEVSGKTKTTTFQMTSGATSGYVLQSDASGNGSWVSNTSSVVAGTGLSYSGTTLNSVWTTSSSNIYSNNSAYVGIGTSSPTRKLHLSSSDQYVSLFEGSNTVGTWLSLKNSTSGADTWNMVSTGSGNGEGAGHFLWTHGTNGTKMILNSTGSLGIGNTSPKSLLDVSGAVGFKISTQSGATTVALDNTATVWYFTGTASVTLPTASTCTNRIYKIMNRSSSSRTISSFTNMSGTATTSIVANSSIEIISDGANWLQIN